MIALFRCAIDRMKALFVAEAALDFEAEVVARNARRKAELLRQASEYERDGLPQVAEEMRSLADRICLREPLACVLPSVDHWLRHDPRPALDHGAASRAASGSLAVSTKKRK